MPVNSLVDQERVGEQLMICRGYTQYYFQGSERWMGFPIRDRVDRDAGGGFNISIENPRMDGPMGEIRTLDQFAENKDHQGNVKKNIFGYHDTKDQLLDHTEDRIMNKEGAVINTIDRQLADGNQCTVSGENQHHDPRGIGTCLVMGGGGYDYVVILKNNGIIINLQEGMI